MPPELNTQPRVARDVKRLLDFVDRQPWGNRPAREADIDRGISDVVDGPELNHVEFCRPDTGIELRRHNAAQFAIIYAYYVPSEAYPRGLVSIRAIRHSRVERVFRGVRETPARIPPPVTFGA